MSRPMNMFLKYKILVSKHFLHYDIKLFFTFLEEKTYVHKDKHHFKRYVKCLRIKQESLLQFLYI